MEDRIYLLYKSIKGSYYLMACSNQLSLIHKACEISILDSGSVQSRADHTIVVKSNGSSQAHGVNYILDILGYKIKGDRTKATYCSTQEINEFYIACASHKKYLLDYCNELINNGKLLKVPFSEIKKFDLFKNK